MLYEYICFINFINNRDFKIYFINMEIKNIANLKTIEQGFNIKL